MIRSAILNPETLEDIESDRPMRRHLSRISEQLAELWRQRSVPHIILLKRKTTADAFKMA